MKVCFLICGRLPIGTTVRLAAATSTRASEGRALPVLARTPPRALAGGKCSPQCIQAGHSQPPRADGTSSPTRSPLRGTCQASRAPPNTTVSLFLGTGRASDAHVSPLRGREPRLAVGYSGRHRRHHPGRLVWARSTASASRLSHHSPPVGDALAAFLNRATAPCRGGAPATPPAQCVTLWPGGGGVLRGARRPSERGGLRWPGRGGAASGSRWARDDSFRHTLGPSPCLPPPPPPSAPPCVLAPLSL